MAYPAPIKDFTAKPMLFATL